MGGLNADEKITWLLDKDLLYKSDAIHEVFRLLKSAYPSASEHVRVRLLERACRGPEGKDAENLGERSRHYAVYNLLYWLHQAAPDCVLTTQRFEQVQKAHEDQFEPRPNPDMRFSVYTVVGTESPFTVDQLLAEDADNLIDQLLSYRGEEFATGPDRSGLLNTVAAAVVREYAWGQRLSVVLMDKKAWDSDLWRALLDGWRQGLLQEEQWGYILTLLQEHPGLYTFAPEISYLLMEGVRKPQGEIPDPHISLAESVADKVWDVCDKEFVGEDLPDDSWQGELVTAAAYGLLEFWLRSLSRKRTEAGESWNGLPEDYKSQFRKVIDGASAAARRGRAILAGHLSFLFALDVDWTRDNFLPLLDWSTDPARAQQAWHSFLKLDEWNEALLPDLLPLYEKVFEHLSSETMDVRKRFIWHLAGIAVLSTSNPLKDEWVMRFLASVDVEDRKTWAYYVGQCLGKLKEDSIPDVWTAWLDKYWTRRINGVPVPLNSGELEKMIEWVGVLAPVFPAVVEKICDSKSPNLEPLSLLYRDLLDKNYAAKYPKSLTKLLRHVLSGEQVPFYHCDKIERLFDVLVSTTDAREDLEEICDELGRLGCANAASMRERLR
jgi:hypothetical protein